MVMTTIMMKLVITIENTGKQHDSSNDRKSGSKHDDNNHGGNDHDGK